MTLLIAVLLLILLVFGISSALNSYAAAQNAASVIAVAHVAEINATGNMIVILTLALGILVVMGLIVAAVIWMAVRNKSQAQPRHKQMRISKPGGEQPMPEFSISDLIQLETLRALRSLSAPQYPQLTAPREDTDNEAEMVELSWLSRR